ncbi:AI-2E family transporter [Patescibacteria group bacterium]|nr:AI-2E family transporter [Patescibacteria group bacterium]
MKSAFAEKWFFLVLFFLTALLVSLIFRPFLPVLVIGASFAVVLSPAFQWFRRKNVPVVFSALIVTALFAVALGVPLVGIGAIVFRQAQSLYQDLSSGGGASSLLDGVNRSIQAVIPDGYSFDVREQATRGVSLVATNLADAFASTLSSLFAVLLMFISIFYFLKDGPRWIREVIHVSPLPDRDDERILTKLSQSIHGILRGYLFIAIVQGLLMGIGLAIFGVPNPALWGLVAMFTSLLPTIGTAFVSIPAILFLFFTGHIGAAVALAVWAVFLVGMVDNFLSPLVVGNKMQIPPLFILFSVLGGIALLGPVGLLVGPLAVSLLHTLLVIYKADFSGK